MIVSAIQAMAPKPKAAANDTANLPVRCETIALMFCPLSTDPNKQIVLTVRLCADGRTFRSAKAAFDTRNLVLEMQLALLEPRDKEFVASGLLAKR